jgi:hypothetical protein
VRVRHLYFSEKLADPNDPTSAVEFYLTVDGQAPKMFDMNSDIPNIVAEQGTVEDWIIENRSSELHAFHIHQLHFLLLQYMGQNVRENFLRDTVNVPYFNGRTLAYPSVRLRMDFRDPNTIGMFPYHCHLLEHEDKGMMGSIRVVPPGSKPGATSSDDSRVKNAPPEKISAEIIPAQLRLIVSDFQFIDTSTDKNVPAIVANLCCSRRGRVP